MVIVSPLFYKQKMNLLLSTIISILTFGAVADNGKTNNAQAINKAIEAAAEKGGG